jgi:hypothetical protein
VFEQDCQKDAGGNAYSKANRRVWDIKKQLIESQELQLKPRVRYFRRLPEINPEIKAKAEHENHLRADNLG